KCVQSKGELGNFDFVQVLAAAFCVRSGLIHLTAGLLRFWMNGLLLGGKLGVFRSEEHTSELQSLTNLVCRLLLEKKKNYITNHVTYIPAGGGEKGEGSATSTEVDRYHVDGRQREGGDEMRHVSPDSCSVRHMSVP